MAEHGVFFEWNGKMVEDEKMEQVNEVQHVYLVGAKSLGAYGGYETFVYKLTEYHQIKGISNIMLLAKLMAMDAWMKTNMRA